MNRLWTASLFVLGFILTMNQAAIADDAKPLRVYFGTYTGGPSKGIYTSTLDVAAGKLAPAQLVAELSNPSFVAIHPTGKFLYSVSEIGDFEGKPVGGVAAYSIDPESGKLQRLNQQSSTGSGPCHLVVDAAGKFVLVANYGGGSVACLPIGADGKLSPASTSIQHQGSGANKQRQEAPHAHSINLDAANKFAFAADLGLDKVLVYPFDSQKGLQASDKLPPGLLAPGSGPRHFAFHPTGKYAFVNNEMTSSVTAFAYDSAKGSLTEIQTLSTLPGAVPGNSTAEIVVHPSGKFVYVSNRGHNSLAMFSCDPATGKLTAIGHQPTGGKIPRNFNIDPSGKLLLAANQESNNVVVFRVDSDSGKLTPAGSEIEVGKPVCVRFLVAR